jgi:hypothetical protein
MENCSLTEVGKTPRPDLGYKLPDRTDEPHGGAKAARLIRWTAGAGVVSQEEKRAFSKIPILDRRNGWHHALALLCIITSH